MKIERSLFIGLGGAGIKSIISTKQFYNDTFGEVPQVIGFLGIDSRCGEFMNSAITNEGETINLTPKESVRISLYSPREYYITNKDSFNWFPEKNLSSMVGGYNGPHRINGRFAYTINHNQIEAGIRHAIDRVLDATPINDCGYSLVEGKIQIYIVFSLCGSTGSGMFLNIAMMIRELFGIQVNINAIAIGPSIFNRIGIGGMLSNANAYGAMLDTEYFINNVNIDNPFKYQVFNEVHSISEIIFDHSCPLKIS